MVHRGAAILKGFNVLVAPGSLEEGAILELDQVEAHHLRVRRVDAFADVTLFDGAGTSARGKLIARGSAVSVSVAEVVDAPPLVPTLLAVGAGDRDRFLSLAERCTELGVSQLIPLITHRSQAVDSRFRESWLEKARRRAREACKQSENPWATSIEDVCALTRLGERYPRVNWLTGAFDAPACPRLSSTEAIGWIIGPEGGLTVEEIDFSTAILDATPVTLGNTIMRFDTAAAAAAVLTADRRTARRDP